MVPASLREPVKRTSRVRAILDRFEAAIRGGELAAGDLVPSENELAATLGVGKSSVREAIKMLEALGVVEVRRGDGTYVCEHPPANTVNPLVFALLMEQGSSRKLLELRQLFEPGMTILAMNRATAEDRERIRRTVTEFEELIEKKEQTAEADLAFHLAILETTHNPLVVRIGKAIFQLFWASIRSSVAMIPETALRDHKRILDAFEEGDEQRLQAAVLTSFEGWQQGLQEQGETT